MEEAPTVKRSLRIRRKTQNKEPEVEKGRWTQAEKEKFLAAITKYGHQDTKKIAAEITTRSALEVLFAVKYWKRYAANLTLRQIQISKAKHQNSKYNKNQVNSITREKNKVNHTSIKNIESWLDWFAKQLATTGNHNSEGVYALSNIFKVIAETEAHPTPEEACGIDFRELYLWIHDLINGRPMKILPLNMMLFLRNVVNEIFTLPRGPNMVSQTVHANILAERVFCDESNKFQNIKTYKTPLNSKEKVHQNSDEIDSVMQEILMLPHLNPFEMVPGERLKKFVNLCHDKSEEVIEEVEEES